MTPADLVARARLRLAEAQEDIRLAALGLSESRPEFKLEVAVIERSRDRLLIMHRRLIRRGYQNLGRLLERLGEDPE